MERLTDLQDQYRRQSLEDRLEAVAEDLRDIKLQIAIMDELFGTDLSVDENLVDQVRTARAAVEGNDYGSLEEMIDDLEQAADSERANVEQTLNQELVSYHDQVKAMRRINDKIDAYPPQQLKVLEVLLDNWNWRDAVSLDEISEFEDQLDECREFGRDMRTIYRKAQHEIIEPLIEEGLEEVIQQLLDSDPIYLGTMESEERENLADSELGDYITLSLG